MGSISDSPEVRVQWGAFLLSCTVGPEFRSQLREGSHGLCQSPQANAKIVDQIRQESFPSTFFVIH
jgi:hypothetical protein